MVNRPPLCLHGHDLSGSNYYLRSNGHWYCNACKIESYHRKKLYTNAHSKDRDKALRLEALEAMGNKCRKCGFDDVRALQFDHIEGGGAKARSKYTNNRYMYIDLINGTARGIQILCANCNWIKKAENNEVRNYSIRTSVSS